MKVLCQVRAALAQRVADAVPGVEVVSIPTEGDLPPDLDAEVLLMLPWANANLAAVLSGPVRWVHALGTGVDAFPFHLLRDDQVLTCSRGGSAVPIAEWVLAMMLAFEKRLPETWIHAEPTGGWSRARLGTLDGKTLGLVGLGAIGSEVAARARPFGMQVRAFRRTRASAPPGIELVGSVHELVASADHVVLAAPATAATHHLIDAGVFAAMKPGAHLVNIARGSLIDQDALHAALDDARVALASLDAVEPEPLPAGHWLYDHPRVRLSPHVSWNAPGAADVLIECFIDNLRRYRAGQPLTGVVDRAAGY